METVSTNNKATNHRKEADDVGKLGKKKTNTKTNWRIVLPVLKLEDDNHRKPLHKITF